MVTRERREEKLAALDAAELNLPGVQSCRGVRTLIRVIECCSGRDGSCIRTDVLAAKLHVSVQTVRRWISHAEKLGILTVDRRHKRNRYRIQWAALLPRPGLEQEVPALSVYRGPAEFAG